MITVNFELLQMFENRIAEFTGAKYAVAVDSCSNALFLVFKWLKETNYLGSDVRVPRQTYVSVPMSLIHAGYVPIIKHHKWYGCYKLTPYEVWDCATYFKDGMYQKGTFMCLSFGWQKPLAIGKGGMILTDSEMAWRWLRRASYDGRERMSMKDEVLQQIGWHMNMDPEMATRGLMLFNMGKYDTNHKGCYKDYVDMKQYEALKEYIL
jgi:dTDP-4-amino-4,6-dideoxygalactose transaminase